MGAKMSYSLQNLNSNLESKLIFGISGSSLMGSCQNPRSLFNKIGSPGEPHCGS